MKMKMNMMMMMMMMITIICSTATGYYFKAQLLQVTTLNPGHMEYHMTVSTKTTDLLVGGGDTFGKSLFGPS